MTSRRAALLEEKASAMLFDSLDRELCQHPYVGKGSKSRGVETKTKIRQAEEQKGRPKLKSKKKVLLTQPNRLRGLRNPSFVKI